MGITSLSLLRERTYQLLAERLQLLRFEGPPRRFQGLNGLPHGLSQPATMHAVGSHAARYGRTCVPAMLQDGYETAMPFKLNLECPRALGKSRPYGQAATRPFVSV